MPSPGYPPLAASAVEITLDSGATYRFGGEPISVRGAGVSVSIGTSGVAPATLDAEQLSRHFLVADGATLTLRNLIITGGYEPGVAQGGSIIVSGEGSALRLFGVRMHGNRVDYGGFLAQHGGAIYAGVGTALNVSRSLFTNNTAGSGGGIAAVGSVLHITGTTFGARSVARPEARLRDVEH